jgi:hypothetical protein
MQIAPGRHMSAIMRLHQPPIGIKSRSMGFGCFLPLTASCKLIHLQTPIFVWAKDGEPIKREHIKEGFSVGATCLF